MSVQVKVLSSQDPLDSNNNNNFNINWKLCLLCQNVTCEKLSDPERNPRADKYEGFKSLDSVLSALNDLNQLSTLPFRINISSLNDGTGMYNTFIGNKAVYHKSCKKHCSESRLARAQKRSPEEGVIKNSPVKTRRLSEPFDNTRCIFCNCPQTWKYCLRRFSDMNLSSKVIAYSRILKKRMLISKIAGAHDLLALKATYHDKCLADFHNQIRTYERQREPSSSTLSESHAYALAELVAYMDEVRVSQQEEDPVPVFKMTDLAKTYATVMKKMGYEHTPHTSRLKERLLSECPYLMAVEGVPGQEIQVTFRANVDAAIRSATKDYESAAFIFSDVAKSIRGDIFRMESSNLDMKNQEESTPLSLKMLLMMIFRGPGCITSDPRDTEEFEQVVNTFSQYICYHTTKRASSSTVKRHLRTREKPVPVYVAMKLYGETRSKSLIQTAHKLGISISYDRLQTILDEKAAASCYRFRRQKVVCPPLLRHDVFTVAAADNLDHDTSSFSAMTSFHGTAISLMQMPNPTSPGRPQEILPLNKETSLELPPTYALVKPCFLDEKPRKVPPSERCTVELVSESYMNSEKEWLESCRAEEVLPWATYHSRLQSPQDSPSITETAVLPLFPDQAHSMAMMVHVMENVSSATDFLNPGQVPVLVVDQPLFALCKTAQFLNPEKHGEEKMVIFMGGLHIEMAALRALGTMLENSGWVNALVSSGVTTQGRAESMIRASHVTRTRYAHQVTAAVLYKLQHSAFNAYIEDYGEDDLPSSFEDWCQTTSESVPQFKYWSLVLKLQCLVLRFVRAVRTGDFAMYKEALTELVGWFFALDQVNYARWLPIHIRDLASLDEKHPSIAEKFKEGHFVARKSVKSFSAISLDQNHEQMNAKLKGNGGMVGLTENPAALRKWVLAAPELASVIDDFEQAAFGMGADLTPHHSDTSYSIGRFQKDCSLLESTFENLGNPFLETGQDLYNIESKVIASEHAFRILKDIEHIGRSQYLAFVKDRLETSAKPLSDTIPQNRLNLWSRKKGAVKSKSAAQIKLLRNDCALFGQLYIASQSRDSDPEEFFSHENQPYPPALSVLNDIRSCSKSDIIKCLTSSSENCLVPPGAASPIVDSKMIDGAALVHMLPIGTCVTFQDYVKMVFLPYITEQCNHSLKRIDIVWDTYIPTSLKNATREKRGSGNRLVVTAGTKLPRKSWRDFLRDADNKTQLFNLLSNSVQSLRIDGVVVVSTLDASVVSTQPGMDISRLSPCNQEEADTRILLHVADAARQGCSRALIRTTDSDVLTLAVAYALKIDGLQELWVSIGTGGHHQIIAAHAVAASLGPEKSAVLPIFHAFSGCDVVSSFAGKGKKSAFDTWQVCDEATMGFELIGSGKVEEGLPLIEKFVVALYDRSSGTPSVNECRRRLFTRKGRSLEAIPPTQDALRQHCLRAGYQGGQIWGQCLVGMQNIPSPNEWGWVRGTDDTSYWVPEWTKLPLVQECLLSLVKCGCKQKCVLARCKCIKKGLRCTELCECGGKCVDL